MDMRPIWHLAVFGVVGVLFFRAIPAPAFDDVPAGRTLWLQGYDLNPRSAAFHNEGVVRLECIDDALPIVLSVAEPGLHNAPDGLVLFAAGAGGSREFRASLLNEGEVRVGYGALFTGPGHVLRNRATFHVAEVAAAWFLGPGVVLRQEAGTLIAGGGLEVRDGEFHFSGGSLVGAPRLVRTRCVVDEVVVGAFRLVMAGDGGHYEGRLRPGQALRLEGAADQGWSRTLVSSPAAIEGELVLTSAGAAGAAILETGDGLTVAESGTLIADAGSGGAREVRGPLALAGTLDVQAVLTLLAESPWRPRGRVLVGAGGLLRVPAGLVQAGGSVELRGGRLNAERGVQIEAGTFSGAGWVDAPVINLATVRAGDAAGPLRITGTYEQAPGARLVLSSVPGGAGESSAPLEVLGDARLAGALRVTTPPGSDWAPGNRLPLIQARRIRGGLDALELPVLPPGLHWELELGAGLLAAVVHEGTGDPRLVMEPGGSGVPRLRVKGGVPLGVSLEYSTNLTTWQPVPVRVEFDDHGVILGGWARPAEAASEFFRTVRR